MRPFADPAKVKRDALRSMIEHRRSLDDIDTAATAKSYGMTAAEVASVVASVRRERESRL